VHHDDRVLIDYRTSDDAGVYRLDAGRALVQTVDFFTPIVDDPFAYGQIAAANALSDVYAMGGRPLTALAIAAFPKDAERTILQQIFAGGLDKLREAGVALLGGHTVQDSEIKFGYAITGEVDPVRVLANAGAKPGDALLLTKPLGTGIIATALKFGRAPQAAIDAATDSMATLNRAAAGVLDRVAPGMVHACTDITGFGLIGHASEVAAASGCSLEIKAGSVPLLKGARALVHGNIPSGGRTNREHFGEGVSVSPGVDEDVVELFYDPQTSGGLLIAVAAEHAPALLSALADAGVPAFHIGRAVPPTGAAITIV
jgi:selenide,water dikinase